MKKRRMLRKVLLLLSGALMVVGLAAGVTLAYFTDIDAVTNTFTVGKVGLTMDEAKVDEYGEIQGADRVKSNEYKLVPGHTYYKDPTVYIDSDSRDGWLFIRLDNGVAGIEAAGNTIASQMAKKGFALVEGTGNVYAHDTPVKASDEIEVFSTFTIDGSKTKDDIAVYENAKVEVTAYLVQDDGFDTAAKAWAATFGQPAVLPSDSSGNGN